MNKKQLFQAALQLKSLLSWKAWAYNMNISRLQAEVKYGGTVILGCDIYHLNTVTKIYFGKKYCNTKIILYNFELLYAHWGTQTKGSWLQPESGNIIFVIIFVRLIDCSMEWHFKKRQYNTIFLIVGAIVHCKQQDRDAETQDSSIFAFLSTGKPTLVAGESRRNTTHTQNCYMLNN